MAVPNDLTILNITGKYTLNKSLTDTNATDEILRLQGVSWFTRRAISLGTITLFIKHYTSSSSASPSASSPSPNPTSSESVEHIDIDQTLSPGSIPGTTELRTLDWTARETSDRIFGEVIGKSRRVVNLDAEIEVPFLREGWTDETRERGVVHSYVESNTKKSGTTWVANQTWGIEEINGERRYVRHVKFTGPNNEDIETKLIYDYIGPL